ncbi:MAG: RecX family transcriptional regulator [Nitrospira sp.]|nr:RecX family transcriptional regulator [Nitrospira sp.]
MKGRSRATSSSPDDALRLAVRFLTYRDRTIVQVEQFLTSRGVSSLQAKQAIRRLSDLRYLDDAAYARRYAEKRLVSRPMGPERLKAELQAKGIADRLADRVIADVFRAVDEESVAQQVVKTAQRPGRRLTSIQIGSLLHQRGFTEETIDHIMMKFGMNEECAHEEQCD